VRLSKSKQLLHNQTVLDTLALRLMMNDGFSFESSITCSELFRIAWVDLGGFAGARRHNLKRISLRYLSKVILPIART